MQLSSESKDTASPSSPESLLGLLVDSLPAFISYIDSDQRYLLANKLYKEYFRVKFGQLKGLHVEEVIGRHAYEATRHHIEASLRGEQQSYEYEFPLGNETRIMRAVYVPHVEKGRVRGIFVLGLDITEQKQAEDELRNSEERYRRLFDSSPISLWEEDFSEVKKYLDNLRNSGVKNFRRYFTERPDDLAYCAGLVKVLSVNQATLQLYEVKSKDEMLADLGKVLGNEPQLQFLEELIALSEGKTRFESEFENTTLRGSLKHVSVILTVVPGYEQTLGKVLVSIVDLTERKRMEEKLTKAERLSAIGETAAMVGHDLRSPMQGITSATYLLRNDSLTREARNELLQLIDDGVDHSNKIVSDLLDYSREVHLTLEKASLRAITDKALEAVKIPNTVKVQSEIFNQETFVDPDRMQRVLVNLISNAVDAMPNGGTLTLTSKVGSGIIEFTIADTGTGMSKQILDNLWKPLQTTKKKGMGLGLPIVKRFIDAHNGEIVVESKQDQGTIFTIRLPIKPLQPS